MKVKTCGVAQTPRWRVRNCVLSKILPEIVDRVFLMPVHDIHCTNSYATRNQNWDLKSTPSSASDMAEQQSTSAAGDEEKTEKVPTDGHNPDLFVDLESLKQWLCYICKKVAKDAVELSCEAHEDDESADGCTFCQNCLQSHIDSHKTCPIGNHPNPTFERTLYIRKQILKAIVKCLRTINSQPQSDFSAFANSIKKPLSSLFPLFSPSSFPFLSNSRLPLLRFSFFPSMVILSP